jgi:hypothetical protein
MIKRIRRTHAAAFKATGRWAPSRVRRRWPNWPSNRAAADLFGSASAAPVIDVKPLHAPIGELTKPSIVNPSRLFSRARSSPALPSPGLLLKNGAAISRDGCARRVTTLLSGVYGYGAREIPVGLYAGL